MYLLSLFSFVFFSHGRTELSLPVSAGAERWLSSSDGVVSALRISSGPSLTLWGKKAEFLIDYRRYATRKAVCVCISEITRTLVASVTAFSEIQYDEVTDDSVPTIHSTNQGGDKYISS